MVLDVEDAISRLQSSELREKQTTLDNIRSTVATVNIFSNLNIDVKLKLLNSIVAALQDANPKIVIAGLGCIEVIIERHFEHYQPLVNMSFDVLLLKLGDARASVRSSATSVMLRLIQAIGVATSFERLSKHIQHKNHRIKDQILTVLSQLTDIYASDIVALAPQLVPKLAQLLSDPNSSTRSLCSDLLGQLYGHMGEGLINDIASVAPLRPSQIDAIRQGSAAIPTPAVGPSAGVSPASGFYATDPPKLTSKPPPSRTTSLSVGRNASANPSSLPSQSTSLAKQSSGDSVTSRGTISSGASTPTTITSTSSAKYRPEYYMSLLNDGTAAKPTSSLPTSVQTQLENEEDWQMRTTALLAVQGVALGVTGTPKIEACVAQLRPLSELIAKQIADLRSSVSKEASRTVAVLAKSLVCPSFASLAEVYVPALIKLLAVKTQVIQFSADRAMRILITSTSGGAAYNRVFGLLFDAAEAKAPATRALALEYICMAVAMQKLESCERHGAQLKRCIRARLSDSDPHARRTTRHLFCLIHSLSSTAWQQLCSSILSDIDASAAKHLQQEMSNPHADVHDLMNLKTMFDAYETFPPSPVISGCSDDDSVASGFALVPASTSPVPGTDDARPSRVPKAFQRARTPLSMRSAVNSVSSSSTRVVKEEGTCTSALPSRRMSLAPVAAESSGNSIASMGGASRRMSVGPMRISRAITSTSPTDADASAFSVTPPLSDITPDNAFTAMPNNTTTTSTRPLSRSGRPTSATGGIGAAQRIARPARAELAAAPNSVPDTISRKPTVSLDNSKSLKSSSRLVPTSTISPSVNDDDSSVGGLSSTSKETAFVNHDQIKTLLKSSKWNERCDGLQAICSRLPHLLSVVNDENAAAQRRKMEEYLDLALSHLSDVHHKVVREAMLVLDMMISVKNVVMSGKLGAVIPALLQRLADKKQTATSANDMLDKCRTVFEAPVIMTALSPRLAEVPERLRVSTVQYMISITPYCESYFASPSNTGAFLNRLAVILGASNMKPSSALTSAGTRLLYLVYKTSTQTVLNQISALPLQQQIVVKRLLQDQIPNIDALTSAAGRGLWNSTHSKPLTSTKVVITADPIATRPPPAETGQLVTDADAESSPVDISDVALPTQTSTPSTSTTAGQSETVVSVPPPSVSPLRPPPHHTPVQTPNALSMPPSSPPTRDITWILSALQADSSRDDKLEAIREVRQLSRNGSPAYWAANCAQILSVLLELFTFTPSVNHTSTARPYAASCREVLTGFTPTKGEENCRENGSISDKAADRMESMHFACKALQMLVKLQGSHVKNFLELLVSRLLKAASFAPVAVSLHCEQILSDASTLDPLRFIRLILPYISCASDDAAVRLIALHTLASAVKHLNSSQLLSVLETIVPTVIPHFSSALVDTRKAVVFVLVEVYLIVGDALRPLLGSLSTSQRKLLTVYIDRQIGKSDRRGISGGTL